MNRNAVSNNILSEAEREQKRKAILDVPVEQILLRAQQRGKELGLECAGAVLPLEAWALLKANEAVLLDIRTVEEYKFVGHVPTSIHVPLVCGASMIRNPGFLHEVEKTMPKEANILAMCRSGKRSAGAAETLTRDGYVSVYNVIEGFEGDLDEERHRGNRGGWRFWGLEWLQD